MDRHWDSLDHCWEEGIKQYADSCLERRGCKPSLSDGHFQH